MHFNPKPLSNLKISSPSKVIWHSYFYSVWSDLFGVSSLLLSVIWSKCVFFVFFDIFRLWITTTFCTAKSFSFIWKRANFFLCVYVCFLEFNFRNDFSKALQLYRFRTRSKRQSTQRNVYFLIDFFFFQKSCSNLACSSSFLL